MIPKEFVEGDVIHPSRTVILQWLWLHDTREKQIMAFVWLWSENSSVFEHLRQQDFWANLEKVLASKRGNQFAIDTVYWLRLGRLPFTLHPAVLSSVEKEDSEDSGVGVWCVCVWGRVEVDEIRLEYLKSLDIQALSRVTRLCNMAWWSGTVPLEWETGVVGPLFKKGDRRVCSSYRGITLLRSSPGCWRGGYSREQTASAVDVLVCHGEEAAKLSGEALNFPAVDHLLNCPHHRLSSATPSLVWVSLLSVCFSCPGQKSSVRPFKFLISQSSSWEAMEVLFICSFSSVACLVPSYKCLSWKSTVSPA